MNDVVFYEKINNKNVCCYFSEPEFNSKKLVIMNHGFRGTAVGPARQFVDFQRILNGKGYSVLRFDQPNSGNSEGDFLDSSFKEWVSTIVFLGKKYIDLGYSVALLGQSMGATASVAASNNERIREHIKCLLLWVPDAKAGVTLNPEEVFEEGGQKYYGKFWTEARDANFFECLRKYNGGIHLVFGETDRYVKQEYSEETIAIVKEKNQPIMILKGQDHSPWEYDLVQNVYTEELRVLDEFLK